MKIIYLLNALLIIAHCEAAHTRVKSKAITRQNKLPKDADWSLQATLTQAVPKSQEGSAVALSADGTILAVGAPHSGSYNDEGETHIYVRLGTTWKQQAVLTQGMTGSREGFSVALSADGTILAVGAHDLYGSHTGGTQIYMRFSNTWKHSATLSQDILHSQEGTSVSLSADGTILAVGASSADLFNLGAGETQIYTRLKSGILWQYQTTLTQAIMGSQEGTSVSLSADGSILASGAINFNDAGATQIYVRSNNSTWQHNATLTQGVTGSDEGFSVALSADGTTLAVGAPQFNDLGGATQIYTRSGAEWVFQTTLTKDEGFAVAGDAVALSIDGNLLAAGAYRFNNSAGATQIYTRSDGIWQYQTTLTQGIENSDEGIAVALSTNGTTLAVGANAFNNTAGATQIYTRSSSYGNTKIN